MNPMSIMAQAEKLSIPELQRSIQDGVVPAFIGVPLLQEKVKKAKQMQMGMAAQQPKRPSVAEQVGQEAQQATIADIMKAQALRMQGEMGQTGGISDSLPKPEGYAKGGPIAFAKEQYVDPRYASLDPFGSYDESYFLSNTPAYEELKRRQGMKGVIEKAGRNLYEGAAGTAKYIGEAPKGVYELLKDPVSKYWYGEEAGLTPKAIDVETPQTTQVTPQTAVLQKQPEVTQPTSNIDNLLNKNAPNKQAPDVDQAQAMQNRIAARKAPPVMGGNAPAPTQTPYAQAAAPATQAPTTQTQPAQEDEKDLSLADYMKQYRDVTGENKGISALQSRLAERESRLAKDEERAPWLALMQAGLATMAGTSPNAMANIGQGGVAGLQAYTHSMNKLEDAKDKSFDIQAKLEEAQRAEQLAAAKYGLDSVQADKKAKATAKLEQKKLDAQMDIAKLKDATDRLQIAASTANAANSLGMRQKELEGSENYLRAQYANLYDKAQNETDPNKKAQLENQLKGLERSVSLGSSRANQTLTPSTVLNSYDERIKGLLTQLSNPALSSKDRLALQNELDAYKKASIDIMKQHGYGIDVGAGLPVGGANQTNNIQSQATEIARKRGLIK